MNFVNYPKKMFRVQNSVLPILFLLVTVFLFNSSFLSNIKSKINRASNNTYYIDPNGNDSNSGTDPSNPWKSIRKVNSVQFQPGDQVLFKCGGVWNDPLIPSASGTSTNPIVFSSYGTGNKPVISGFLNLRNWTSRGNGIWESDCRDCNLGVNMVTINSVERAMGRYPNVDSPNKGYLTIDSHDGSTSINSSGLSGSPNWTGAEVVIRKNQWIIDRNKITQQDGNTINYNSGSKYPAQDKFGFFIQNDPKTLDEFGEWYFDALSNKLLIFFGSINPSSADVEVSTKPVLISINSKSNILISNISLQGSKDNAIIIDHSSNLKLDNISIGFSGTNAITAKNTSYLLIANSLIKNTNNNAITCSYLCNNITIANNSIRNTGIIPGMGLSGDATYYGISMRGTANVIDHNRIDSTGYIPIAFQGDIVVKNNYINCFAFVKDDGGGIYTGDANNNIPLNGVRQIIGNFIENGLGARDGSPKERYFPNSTSPWTANGIYLDDNTKDINVVNNTTINNNGSGIYLHNASNVTVTNNTMYNNHVQLLLGYDLNLPDGITKNNNIVNNILVSGKNSKYIADFRSSHGSVDIEHMSSFDHNYYIHQISTKEISTMSSVVGLPVSSAINMSNWKSGYNKRDLSFIKLNPGETLFLSNTSDKPKVTSLNKNYTVMIQIPDT